MRIECWLVALLGLTAASLVLAGPYAPRPPGGIDRKAASDEARSLAKIILCHKGGEVTSYSRWGNRVGTLQTLGIEEGRSDHPQPRTGFEVQYYNKLKEHARLHPGQPLDKAGMLKIGMDVCTDQKGNVNLPDVFLTIHNVTRLVARPDQLVDPKAREFLSKDPNVAPIIKDLFSNRIEDSSDGHETMPAMFGMKGAKMDLGTTKKGDVTKTWSLPGLFAMPKPGESGIFKPVQGVRDATGNGGAYYYFWLGAFAGCTGDVTGLGEAGLMGMWMESDAKKNRHWLFNALNHDPENPDEYLRGVMQLTHFGAGNMLGDKAKWSVAKKNLKGGFVSFKQKQTGRYCTNNPNIQVPMPLPQEVKRKDLPKPSDKDQMDMARKLLDAWKAQGIDVSAAEAFMQALLDRRGPLDKYQDMPGFLQALSQGDPAKIAQALDKALADPKNRDPRIQAAGKAAIQEMLSNAEKGKTADDGC